MRFDLTDLRLFLHVVETGSITHGAGRAHLALASASARIRGMEDSLGVGLLARGRRGARPTPAGEALAHHARVVLQQIERMKGELGDYARGLKGHVRVLCNTSAMSEFLPDALAAYLAGHPTVDIDMEERPSYRIVQDVAQGLADLGIVADTVDRGGLQTFPFRRDRLVLVVPRGHRLTTRRQIAFRDVVRHEFVGLGADSALQEHIGQHAARAGHPLKLRVRVRGFEAVCHLVARGVGLGIVPETAALRCQRTMAIAGLRLTDAWTVRHLAICVRRFEALPVQAQRLVEHLKSA
jgi:DNA-binding transcriptional LysR family regulator